ncbi:hypothetical protein [Nocardioides soli]|uniref:Uncharacterized protein n=1 Tax=Nocardioides soli TaxID=1036020 RepID=A0A7W4W1I9_9ACTN|nr:hypothetical protein [Nocardioides soli]MBB3045570.1 hypothetical protein [Nocardioides soli]
MSSPPTDFARIELFCELVDEYDDLADAFPMAEPSLQLVPFSHAPAPDRWARVVRAMALRKFAIGKRDEVYVPKVLDSATNCLTDPTLAANVDSYRDGFRGLGLAIRTVEGEGVETTAPEIIEDLIYGGLLHGDYDRHERMKVRPNMTHDLSLWQFTGDVEHFIRELRGTIRRSIEQGILTGSRIAG